MHKNIYIGCCGWSYLRPKEFQTVLTKSYSSVLQAYAQLYGVVEVNSTFYRIPKLSTAQKWRQEASAINRSFQFTVKAYQGITHIDRFGKKSRVQFESVKEVAAALNASVVLFQSPASFHPTGVNMKRMKAFFSDVERGGFILAWESRGKWLDNPHALAEVCEECDLIHCVDPFRNQALSFSKSNIAYCRLHGFGKPSMYRYNFSEGELRDLRSLVQSMSQARRAIYVFFNNEFCYQNAISFSKLADET